MSVTTALQELSNIATNGELSSCEKHDLERFANALCSPKAYTFFADRQYPQVCESIRLALTLRMSEEQNIQAQKESRIALIIACVALLAGIVQAVVSYLQFSSTEPISVKANTPLPVVQAEPIQVKVQVAPVASQSQNTEKTAPGKHK